MTTVEELGFNPMDALLDVIADLATDLWLDGKTPDQIAAALNHNRALVRKDYTAAEVEQLLARLVAKEGAH